LDCADAVDLCVRVAGFFGKNAVISGKRLAVLI
jgi:hypothetical protein